MTDTNVGVTYYIGNDIVTFKDKPSRVILSMPSQYSIKEKTDYIKTKKLGGVITWMVGNDTSYQLADYVYNGLQ